MGSSLGSLSRFGTQPEISFLGPSPQERMLGLSLFIVPPSQLGGSACPVNLNGPGRGGPGTARAAPGPSAAGPTRLSGALVSQARQRARNRAPLSRAEMRPAYLAVAW